MIDMASGNSESQSSGGGASQKSSMHEAGSGIRAVRTTSLFRAVNFELYAKPNKVVMAFGLIAITGCVGYVAYMNATKENKADEKLYEKYQSDGTTQWTKTSRSRWD